MQGFEERRSGPDFANVTHLEETPETKKYFNNNAVHAKCTKRQSG